MHRTPDARGQCPFRLRGRRYELLKAGNGSRGVIFAWQEGADVGHFFNAVNHGGNVKFLDGQAGGYADMDWDHWEFMHTGGGAQ
ncbi:toxin glutamine deamidase domain-containing protein [Streptomyces sp. NBC_01235]|uniref:toxin glutamine deamidase domain-containing protein n=1 Tax=Streptomyces sp. NBC_01235 TaxID=2903788 RepID=UPI003FA3A5F2